LIQFKILLQKREEYDSDCWKNLWCSWTVYG